MKIRYLLGASCICLSAVSFNSNAALDSRLGGLAFYDDVANLTWLANANTAGTRMSWIDANLWAASLSVDGVGGWRLPDTVQPDFACTNNTITDVSFGFNCTGSEMGDLFYNVLGGNAGASIFQTHNANYDLFSNVFTDLYWTATGYAIDPAYAWAFNFGEGSQGIYLVGNEYYAWAVKSGDVGGVPVPVPVPAAVWLFGSGLIGLIGVACRKKTPRSESSEPVYKNR